MASPTAAALKRPAEPASGQPPLKIVKTGGAPKAPLQKAPLQKAPVQKAPAGATKAPVQKAAVQKTAGQKAPAQVAAQKAPVSVPKVAVQKTAAMVPKAPGHKTAAPVQKASAQKSPAPARQATPAAKKSPSAPVPQRALAPVPKVAASAAQKAEAPAQKPEEPKAKEVEPNAEAVKATPVQRSDSWTEFSDVDPVYAMIGELQTKKDTLNSAGVLDEDVVRGYLQRLFIKGVVKKYKVWHEVWAAMQIPIDMQKLVLQTLLEVGLESELADSVPDVLAELTKGHRCKVKAVEEAISTIFECGADQNSCIARFLLLIFPKSPTSEWGWSRVGWNWQQWWGTADKIFSALDPSSAFETLCELLKSIETDSGAYLPHQQIWDAKRLETVRAALCKYGDLLEDELGAALDMELS